MYNKLILTTALLFSAAFSQPIFADEVTNKNPKHSTCSMHASCGCMKNLTEKLGLSSEQAAKIKAIKQQEKKEKAKYHQDISTLHHQIKELMSATKLDEAKLDTLLNKKKELSKARVKSQYEARQQIMAVLNTQQKAKYEEMLKKAS